MNAVDYLESAQALLCLGLSGGLDFVEAVEDARADLASAARLGEGGPLFDMSVEGLELVLDDPAGARDVANSVRRYLALLTGGDE